MKSLKEAAEMVVECFDNDYGQIAKDCAMADLRRALAENEQGRLIEITRQFVGVKEDGSELWVETEYRTAIRNKWVGLDDKETAACYDSDNPVEAAEDKLREKNT